MGIFVFFIGIILGSFYNAVLYRIPNDISIADGRSICPNCKTKLKPIDLVPVFSWAFLKGKCRYCSKKISVRYPLIELITGLIFYITYYFVGYNLSLITYLSFFSMLLITTIIDFEYKLISLNLLGVCSLISSIGLIATNTNNISKLLDNVLGVVIGAFIYAIIFFVAKFIYKKEAFGEGDIYLMASIGLVLGFQKTIFTAFASFFVALFFIVLISIVGKKFDGKDEIPFGPYMCITAVLILCFGNYLIDSYIKFMFGV